MKLFVTQAVNGTNLFINPNHVSYIEQMPDKKWIMVMGTGQEYNVTEVEAKRVINLMMEMD